MFSFLKRKKTENPDTLRQMDGREVKYVTKRVRDNDGNVKEVIFAKSGRIVVIGGEIRIMCAERDVFCCKVDEATYFTLLSGDGITVSGVNSLNGEKMDIIVYYTYHRK